MKEEKQINKNNVLNFKEEKLKIINKKELLLKKILEDAKKLNW